MPGRAVWIVSIFCNESFFFRNLTLSNQHPTILISKNYIVGIGAELELAKAPHDL